MTEHSERTSSKRHKGLRDKSLAIKMQLLLESDTASRTNSTQDWDKKSRTIYAQ